jgi:hypothetical protein
MQYKLTTAGLRIVNREQGKKLLEESKLNPEGKGIIFLGLVGIGKTQLIRTPRMTTARALYDVYTETDKTKPNDTQGVRQLINNMIDYEKRTVSIDEIGVEENAKRFGNVCDPIEWCVMNIYEANKKVAHNDLIDIKPIKLYMTSNLNLNSLVKRYGDRVIDRLYEMCDIYSLEDTNLRKS